MDCSGNTEAGTLNLETVAAVVLGVPAAVGEVPGHVICVLKAYRRPPSTPSVQSCLPFRDDLPETALAMVLRLYSAGFRFTVFLRGVTQEETEAQGCPSQTAGN